MGTDITTLPEIAKFFLITSPFLVIVVTLGVLFKKGYKAVSTYSSFWIIVSLVLSLIYIYRLLSGETVDFLLTSTVLANILVVYRELKLRGR